MSYDHRASRPAKNQARNIVTTKMNTTRKVALFITVPGVPDIKSALKSGLINKQTKIIAINHCLSGTCYDPKIAAGLRRSLDSLGMSYVLVDKHLESVAGIEAIQTAGNKWGKIDFAFIDLCGMVSPSVCYALNQLQENFASSARIALTATMEIRQRKSIWSYMWNFKKLDERALKIFSTPESGEWMTELFQYWQVNFPGTVVFSSYGKSRARRINNITNFVWQWQAVTAAFDCWEIQVSNAVKYGDGLTMGLVIFELTNQKTGGEFEAIRKICQPKGAKSKSGFSAAKQAWITRYERLLKETEHNWADLAWLDKKRIIVSTCKIKAKLAALLLERDGQSVRTVVERRQTMLSRRAKKAWATRRANATAK